MSTVSQNVQPARFDAGLESIASLPFSRVCSGAWFDVMGKRRPVEEKPETKGEKA